MRPDIPSFAGVTVADQVWVVDEAIETFTPLAAGNDSTVELTRLETRIFAR